MPSDNFVREAIAAGFSQEQAEFMEECLSRVGHIHEIDDINGLEDEFGSIEEDEEDE